MTNLLLFLGLVLPLRPLLIPWLASHSLLSLALSSASVYYLVLYVLTDECGEDCPILIGLACTLISAVIVLAYCIYLVQDYFDVLKYVIREKKEKSRKEEKV